MSIEPLLQLLQLADSQVPIGAAAHSFGLETQVDAGYLKVDHLEAYFCDHLAEAGAVEAAACRAAHRLASTENWLPVWGHLNTQMSARKPARESRAASLTLGRRLLSLAADLTTHPALQAAQAARGDCHHAPVFGLIGGVLELPEDLVTSAFVHQTLMGQVSACQRLLPLGQQAASRLLWRLKPAVLAATQDMGQDWDRVPSFLPLPEIAAMRHPDQPTRLFVS